MRAGLAPIVALVACVAPVGQRVITAPVAEAQPAERSCTCLVDLQRAEAERLAPEPGAPQETHEGDSAQALIRVASRAAGLLTWNPPAWALIGQAASIAISLAARTFRRRSA